MAVMIVVTIAEFAQSYIAQARSSRPVQPQFLEPATGRPLRRAHIVAALSRGSACDFPPWLEFERPTVQRQLADRSDPPSSSIDDRRCGSRLSHPAPSSTSGTPTATRPVVVEPAEPTTSRIRVEWPNSGDVPADRNGARGLDDVTARALEWCELARRLCEAPMDSGPESLPNRLDAIAAGCCCAGSSTCRARREVE